jgi:hypothetical protein
MTHHNHNHSVERALDRFDWLIEQVRDEVHRSDIFEIQGVLGDPEARTSAKERALVILGLLGTAEAGAMLQWFDSTDQHWRVCLLHRLAKRECTRRRRGQPQSSAAAPTKKAA